MNLVIVPVVCGVQMTRDSIDSLLAQDVETSVFAIDNGSTDGCGELLRAYGSKISRIAYTKTRGLDEVWNNALDMAFGSLKLDHALVVNNDVVLRPDMYKLLLADGGDFVTGVGVSTKKQMELIDVRARSPHPSFSCFLIRKNVWQRVGRFDERFHSWCSDGDYHLRMDAAGVDAYSIGLPFLHVGSGTLKSVDQETHERLCRQADADRVEFIKKYGFAIGSDAYYESFKLPRDNKYERTGTL
jgi:glycosyltransferase involved in cell wall biosynthesis